jgi:hypothetical protein
MGIVVDIRARKLIEGLSEVYQDCAMDDSDASYWIVRLLTVGNDSHLWDTIVCNDLAQANEVKAAIEHAFFLGHTEVFRDVILLAEKHSKTSFCC